MAGGAALRFRIAGVEATRSVTAAFAAAAR
jgi:hypothetical protein